MDSETEYESDTTCSSNIILTEEETDYETDSETDYESDEEDFDLKNLEFLKYFNFNDFLLDEDEDTQIDEDTKNDDPLFTKKQPPMETRIRLSNDLVIDPLD